MNQIFEPTKKSFIGVIHVPALPGDALGTTRKAAFDAALRDLDTMAESGVDGIIIENFGSVPFHKGTPSDPTPPHQIAALAVLANIAKEGFPGLKIGVNCLRNDAKSALGAASASGADFIRVNVHASSFVTDQGIIESDAANTLTYRKLLGGNIGIMADILVKHSVPLGETDPARAAEECVGRGLADALIVSGHGTGAPVSLDVLRAAKSGAASAPVLIGSGLTLENAVELLAECDGAIVGTALKVDGITRNPVDPARVKALAAFFR